MTKPKFDIDAALKSLQEGKPLTGKDGILTPLIKQLTEGAMQAELDKNTNKVLKQAGVKETRVDKEHYE